MYFLSWKPWGSQWHLASSSSSVSVSAAEKYKWSPFSVAPAFIFPLISSLCPPPPLRITEFAGRLLWAVLIGGGLPIFEECHNPGFLSASCAGINHRLAKRATYWVTTIISVRELLLDIPPPPIANLTSSGGGGCSAVRISRLNLKGRLRFYQRLVLYKTRILRNSYYHQNHEKVGFSKNTVADCVVTNIFKF